MSLLIDDTAQNLLFRTARTANTFTEESVTDGQMRAVYDLIKYGPTEMNGQPLRIVLVRSPEARDRLLVHMDDGNKAKTGSAPLVAIMAAYTNFHTDLHRTFPHAPTAREKFDRDEELRVGSARLSAALQVGYFILGVRAAGLAAGQMVGFDAAGINKTFFPDGEHEVLAVINLGKPGADAWFGRGPRLDYDDVVTTA
ncbi:3-hydroxypropanoate dehydrogenase [Asanoa ferruginea]|uniref:3-hydroxypropanoate dehydrogenase n=1 Tax=Asanoa ferruginea TaxID=53367 RepID=A0A3E0A3B1_9ACTN|nr:malonic semialdehyde reductase [Asanoa ferruginea]REG00811.1 3-hydroxypropanoate dehydrogenase [Asanoa ferruginea]GIF47314.1 putative NADH dehydrogenase/NAD(P)H nitroreductase [Asanoa ferruginea]